MTSTNPSPFTSPPKPDPLSWEVIVGKVVDGLVTGMVASALDWLFGAHAKSGQNLRSLFEEFADDIVYRVTANVREEIRNAISDDNMRKLNVSAMTLAENYRLYDNTKDAEYIVTAERAAIETTNEAHSLELMALGIYQVVSSIKMAVFVERGHIEPTIREIEQAKKHVDHLHQQALSGAEAAIGKLVYVGYTGKSEAYRVSEEYTLTVYGEVQHLSFSPSGPGGSPAQEYRQGLIDEQKKIVTNSLIIPSNAIVAKWDKLADKLSAPR